jgi:isopentenyl-diphosphate Delta-isomerase
MSWLETDITSIKTEMKTERLILVDEHDRELGTEEKLKTHIEGKLHRAFSIFVFDDANRLLLQKRASSKYHSGGLWSNTCCGHPRPGEQTIVAARRRLVEEMNFKCELRPFFAFQYRAELANRLIENEYDHVFIGRFNGSPVPEKTEVEDWKWIDMADLKRDLDERPYEYSYWLLKALGKSEWQSLRTFMNEF